MNDEPTTALTTINGEVLPEKALTMIRPLATPDEAVAAWQAFQALKGKLVTQDDIQHIQGRDFVKKSGWRKIAAAFGISTEAVAEDREDIAGGWLWRVRVRATAPNGRFAEGTAGCASNERRFSHPEHDVYAQAYTRACNRAISDLVGGGDVSAEEVKAEPRPTLTAERASEMLEQFQHSCDTQGLKWGWFELTILLMCNGGDLRRAFKTLKDHEPEEVLEHADDE